MTFRRLLLFPLLSISVAVFAADDPSAVVKYRQSSMKAMGAHMGAISVVVKKQVSSRAQLAAHAEAIRATADGLAAFFPKGTGPDKVATSAKTAVWEQWGDFDGAMKQLQREAAALSAVARKGDAAAFDAQFARVGEACSDCHKQFRARDKE